nr:putative replication associated protein [Crucivirus sp.]
MNTKSALSVYDFTLGSEFAEEDELKLWLKDNCKKWAFQLECGEDTGYVHWQGRFSLHVRLRQATLKNKMPWPEIHLSPTSTACRDNMFYVTKAESRLDGPWQDTDRVIFIPEHLQIKEFLPWQNSIVKMITAKPGRTVNFIYDPVGCSGKSTIAGWLACQFLACTIPFCNDYRDIMRMVMNQDKLGTYFIDMPRAVSKDKLRQLFGGIESIKDGYAYDDRYKFKSERFEQPHVFVFGNVMPDTSYLSLDRWRFWEINDKKELVERDKDNSVYLFKSTNPLPSVEIDWLHAADQLYGSNLFGLPSSGPRAI